MALTKLAKIETLSEGMKLFDEDRREFYISALTTRVAVICNANGFVESVSHGFVKVKYRVAA